MTSITFIASIDNNSVNSYPLEQTSLLAELSDVRPVIVSEHLVSEDSVCYLRDKE